MRRTAETWGDRRHCRAHVARLVPSELNTASRAYMRLRLFRQQGRVAAAAFPGQAPGLSECALTMTMSTRGTYTALPASVAAGPAAQSPAGDWLFYDAVYDRLRDARRQEDASLPQGVWQRDTSAPIGTTSSSLPRHAHHADQGSPDRGMAARGLECTRSASPARRGLRLVSLAIGIGTISTRPDGDDYSGRA